jgi:hypothetical protein
MSVFKYHSHPREAKRRGIVPEIIGRISRFVRRQFDIHIKYRAFRNL